MLFRDRELADAIGFRYARSRAEDAAQDLVEKLAQLANDAALVTVALDGENAWEHYVQSGEPFLDALYQRLGSETRVQTVLPREELLRGDGAQPNRIERLHSGSWIESSYRIWIGHPEDNAGWTLLGQARAMVAAAFCRGKIAPGAAREGARCAAARRGERTGSGGTATTSRPTTRPSSTRSSAGTSPPAYTALGKTPPAELGRPIIRPDKDASVALDLLEQPPPPDRAIDRRGRARIFRVDGRRHLPSRPLAGRLDAPGARRASRPSFLASGRTSSSSASIRARPRWRRACCASTSSAPRSTRAPRRAGKPRARARSSSASCRSRSHRREATSRCWTRCRLDVDTGRSGAIVELAVQLSTLGLEPQARFGLLVRVLRGEAELERLPRYGEIALAVPGLGFEAAHWQV